MAPCARGGAGAMAMTMLRCASDVHVRSRAFVEARTGDALREPAFYVMASPTDGPPVKSLLGRKVPNSAQRCEDPPVAPRESRDVVGAQEFLIGRKAFIDPLGE